MAERIDNYALFTMAKLKTPKSLQDAYNHNERVYKPDNADPARRDLNVEVVSANGRTYNEMLRDTLDELKIMGVPSKTIRKDAVLALEIVVGFSRERDGTIDLEKWVQESLAWADKNFNPPNHEIHYIDTETGQERTERINNIKHAVLHRDESNPHMHLLVVPVDDKGNLNSSFFNRGRQMLIGLQSSYAEDMKQFGLERGEYHSTATHQQMSAYYTNIKEALEAELPEPLVGETIESYRERANHVYQVEKSHHNNDVRKLEQKVIQAESRMKMAEEQVRAESKRTQNELKRLQAYLGVKEIDDEGIRQLSDQLEQKRKLDKAIKEFPIREVADDLERQNNNMIDWITQKELAEEAEKEKNKGR